MLKKELFQIGEVSHLFHISVSILRHYEKIGLLTPEYVDERTGYRYYSSNQFERLNMIRYLRTLDMPLEEITSFLNNRDVDKMRSLLQEQKERIEQKRKELERIEQKITKRLKQIDTAKVIEVDQITLEKQPTRRLAFLRQEVVPRSYLDLEPSIRELEKNESASITFLGKVGIGLSSDAIKMGKFQPYEFVFIILDDEDDYQGNSIELQEELCVVIRFRGSHEIAPKYYKKLVEYIKKEDLEITGFSKEITMIDDGMTNDRTQFLTEIQIPVL